MSKKKKIYNQICEHVAFPTEIMPEMFSVLNLIVAEFQSDPMSVQCFDLRTVDRAKKVVKAYKDAEARICS